MKLMILTITLFFSNLILSQGTSDSSKWAEMIKTDRQTWIKSLSKADVNKLSTNSDYFVYLLRAFVAKCKGNELQVLLDKGLDPNVKGNYESLAELTLMFNTDNVCLNLLLDAGLDINITTEKYKKSLLETAVAEKNKNAIALICRRNIVIDKESTTYRVIMIMTTSYALSEFVYEHCSDVLKLDEIPNR